MDVFKESLDIFRERQFKRVDEIIPIYICSIGCHVFNIMNKKKQIFWTGDIVPDMRLHIFMVTLPGFGKTQTINQFMDKSNGILVGTKIRGEKIGNLTSAGLVGSIKSNQDGDKISKPGILATRSESILASDEFSNILEASKTSHSGNLINDLLTATDDGLMNKAQSGGSMSYQTYCTIWGATQPGRFELKSGLARRFVFVTYMPSLLDVKEFKLARRKAMNVRLNPVRIGKFRADLDNKIMDINTNLERIEFTDDWYDWLEKQYTTHYEDFLYEKIALGYHIMKTEVIPKVLKIGLTSELKVILLKQFQARSDIARGLPPPKVIDLLNNIKSIKYDEVMHILLTLGLSESYILTSIEILKGNNKISIADGVITNLSNEGGKKI